MSDFAYNSTEEQDCSIKTVCYGKYVAKRWLCADAILQCLLFFKMDCQLSAVGWRHDGMMSN